MSFHLRHFLANKPSEMSVEEIKNIIPNKQFNIISKYFKDKVIDRFALHDKLEYNQLPIVIVVPTRNNQEYVYKNLKSISLQKYNNFRIIYIDDLSDDNTWILTKKYIEQLGLINKTTLIQLPSRLRQGGARFTAYHLCDDDEIICMLDGDDWLYGSNVLSTINNFYKLGYLCSYGSYIRYINGTINRQQIYGNDLFDKSTLVERTFRDSPWISQHLRTAYAGLFKRIKYSDIVDNDNNFFTMCTDVCEMMPILEMASPNIIPISKIQYVYNIDASNRYYTSWFRRNTQTNKIREKYMQQIKNTNKYSQISLKQIINNRRKNNKYKIVILNNDKCDIDLQEKYQYIIFKKKENSYKSINETFLYKCIDILNRSNLSILLFDIKVKNSLIILDKNVSTGYWNGSLQQCNFSIINLSKFKYIKNIEQYVFTNKLVVVYKINQDNLIYI